MSRKVLQSRLCGDGCPGKKKRRTMVRTEGGLVALLVQGGLIGGKRELAEFPQRGGMYWVK